MASKKEKKTLYFPSWLVVGLTKEGDVAGGPGLIAAAAINAFLGLSPEQRVEAIKAFQDRDLRESYGLMAKEIVDVAVKARRDAEKSQPPTRKRRLGGS